jgi:hypothetical protein
MDCRGFRPRGADAAAPGHRGDRRLDRQYLITRLPIPVGYLVLQKNAAIPLFADAGGKKTRVTTSSRRASYNSEELIGYYKKPEEPHLAIEIKPENNK